MKLIKFFLLSLCLLALPSPAQSGSVKTITLKDGSTIKGEVLSLQNGVYTVRSLTLGEIQLKEDTIVAITAEETAQENPSAFKNEVLDIQGEITKDPQLMEEIKHLMADEEVLRLLSDPNLMNDVMTFDEEKIKSNPSVQKLLEHQQIRKIMGTVEQKYIQK